MEQEHQSADDVHMARAVELAAASAAEDGGPFGALIVTRDGRVFPGTNRVTAAHDPTAHAEIAAIRRACSALEDFELRGAVLYSSCEPCPMCLAAALWSRISRVVFAASREDAAEAGFDDADFYDYFDHPERRDRMPVSRLRDERATEPFSVWAANAGRTAY